jgi:phage terminase large subunit
MADIALPAWAEPLFEPRRYKVAYGGRGSGKSWAFAMALLILGSQRTMRVLCAREIQKSLRDSVHQLLTDQIQALGLSHHYEIYDTEIRGKNGTLFTFAGLQQHTVTSIKSYEGADICWVEEAQTVSKKSWDVLIPTIRKRGSEIWVTFNPDLDTDETWRRFVETPPPDSWVEQVNYLQNPWFPPELEAERKHSELTDPDAYRNIWLGECKAAVDGAIYASEMSAATTDGRITLVPHDPKLPAHSVWDLGWNDATSIVIVQRVGPTALAVIDYIEDSHRTLDSYAKELRDRPYSYASHWIPHDGTHKDIKTGQSVQDILSRHLGMRPEIVPRQSIETGIKLARMALSRAYFDKAKTAGLLECLKRYRRTINAQTGEPGAPVHDAYSHGADAWRYVATVADQLPTGFEPAYKGPEPEEMMTNYDTVAGY